MNNLNQYVDNYKKQLALGDIQKAYKALMNYMMNLKSYFQKQHADGYSLGYISPGYMDYTYFSISDEYMRKKKLRFGIVLNHDKVQFELWLLGQNEKVHQYYWEIFKSTKWNEGVNTIPKYSILEITLLDNPNFENIASLNQQIEDITLAEMKDVMDFVKQLK